MRYPDQMVFLLDENSSSPAGGAPDGGGGTSAPAPASQGGGATPPEGAEAAPASGRDPFDGMESNDYYDTVDLGPAPAETGDEPGPADAVPAAPARAEPPAPTTTAPAVPQESQVPVQPQAAPPGNVGPPQSQVDQTLETLKQQANQTALADWASQNLFKLSDEDVAAYEADPGNLIPKLMGRVYTHAMQSAVNLIKNLVPEMVNSGITTQQASARRASEALNEFYQSNPHLSADQHGAAVDKWARAFRSMNPTASRSEAIAFVGKAVSAEFGIWPQANGTGAPAAPRRAAPFAPARQGGRAPASQKGPHDPYAGMEDEYDQ